MFGPLQKTWIHDQVCLDCTSLNDTATPFECWGKCMWLLTALRYLAYASTSMFESIVCCDSRRLALPHSIRTAQLLRISNKALLFCFRHWSITLANTWQRIICIELLTCAVAVAVAVAILVLQQANTWERISCMAVAVAVARGSRLVKKAGVTTGRARSEICIN